MKKFTLIELLVVVAIIGILAAMILPALGKARQKAKEAKCRSNLKGIGTLVSLYYTDGDSEILPLTWLNSSSSLEIDNGLLTCPVASTLYEEHPDSTGANATYTGSSETGLARDASNASAHLGSPEFTVYQDGSVR